MSVAQALKIDGTLGPAGAEVPLAGYRIELRFKRQVHLDPDEPTQPRTNGAGDDERSAETPGRTIVFDDRASTSSDSAGRFALDPGEGVEIVGPTVEFVVSAPSGETVGGETIKTAALSEPVMIEIEPMPVVALEPIDGPAPAPLRRVGGRVIDLAGKPLPTGLQVVVMARRAESPADAEPEPVMLARVDRSGAFFADVPNEEYVEATAAVPGVEGAIPIPLENGRIAAAMLLPFDLDDLDDLSAKPGDCSCDEGTAPRRPTHEDIALSPETFTVDLGTGECLKFNKPNRVVEEFEFFSVVRTTEPLVRRLTLAEVERESRADNVGPPEAASLTAIAYDVRLDTREIDEGAVLEVRLVTTDEKRHVLVRRVPDGWDPQDGYGTPVPRLIAESWLRLAAPTNRSWSVAQNAFDGQPIGLDLRSIKQVEVAGTSTSMAWWALCGIGISATTSDGESVTIRIDGVEFHQRQPWLELFRQKADDTPTLWTAGAGVAVAAAFGAVAGGRSGRTRRRRLGPAVRPELSELQDAMGVAAGGRSVLGPEVTMDWDETPTFHEAASVAHGHLLHFKQEWYADGYSLGDLLYSLPLAPGQKKLISVVDWERRESATREETTSGRESLDALVTRDRDLGEVVSGALTESMRGGSRNTTSGIGVGTGAAGNGSYQGMNFGALLGVSGGYGQSDSGAWQLSGKTIAADSLQTLRDKTLQSASAVRSLRTSVVQTVSQGDSTRVTTEVVANHNHCHALTIQYFEVLRHLQVVHRLADVRECLFVPLPVSPFDGPKTLRWRQSIEAYLRRPELALGFDAARRVETDWSEVDYPVKRYADEQVASISGELELTILIPLPPLPRRPPPKPEATALEVSKAIQEATNPTAGFLGVITAIATGGASLLANQAIGATEKATKAAIEGSRALAEELLAETSPEAQYEKFQREVMPGVAAGFVDQLELYALVNGSQVQIGAADFTLVSEYRPAVPLLASVRATLPPGIARGAIQQIRVKSRKGLPNGCRVIVNSATFRYRTRLFEHGLVEDRRANDDIDLPVVRVSFGEPLGIPTVTEVASGSGAALSTPLDAWEQRDPRTEDRALAASLVEHLNEHLEYYHHAIWWTMDPNRRYMLLDGFEAPGSGGRSIASVVDNRLIGIVGNSLVLPVAQGVHLDPRLRKPAAGGAQNGRASLLSLYDAAPLPPASMCLPTRGVFAEAVMGNCNACERIDESRLWRWDESPIDEPPAIEPVSTASRRTEPLNTTPTAFPTPIVSIQNAPDVPSPAGVAAALDALGTQVFSDITGLEGTQANAAAAYAKAMDTALAFGKEASTLAQQASMMKGGLRTTLEAIDQAYRDGNIDDKQHNELTVAALKKQIGDDGKDISKTDVEELTEKAGEHDAKVSVSKPTGEKVEIDAKPPAGTPPPKKPAPAKPRTVPVSIRFRAFVPSEIWEPFPSITSAANPVGLLRFNGDSRGFDPSVGSSRADLLVNLRIDPATMGATVDNSTPRFGWAEVYALTDTEDVANQPEWWERKKPGVTPLIPKKRMQPTEGKLSVDVEPQGDRTVVTIELDAQPQFPWGDAEIKEAPDIEVAGISGQKALGGLLAATVPNMNATVTIVFTRRPSKQIQYQVSGLHDGFPAFELYVNGERAWEFMPTGDAAPEMLVGLADDSVIEPKEPKLLAALPR